MADEAFALSPISARPTLPGEEDYAAISEAFMETSRGRWFLTEYAKRNRNADTSMVLDAVARIEQSLAAQKEEALAAQQQAATSAAAAAATAATAAAKNNLAEALAAIRGAVEAAQASAVEALDSLALQQRLAPVRKGARVLREIAWRLREIGNDGRICDLIDSQVAVIETGAEQISSDEAKVALGAAFAALQGRLAEFGDDDRTAAPSGETVTAPPSPAPPEAPPAGMAETIEATAVPEADEASAASLAEPAEAALESAETALAQADALDVADVTDPDLVDVDVMDAVTDADVTDSIVTDSEVADEAADAHDEAILDMIATEMGAPDPIEDDEIVEALPEQAQIAEPVEPEIIGQAPETAAVPVEPPAQVSPPAAIEAADAPAMEVSLGSTIIARGMLRTPASVTNDPLAPVRRMSQVEKIAFFS